MGNDDAGQTHTKTWWGFQLILLVFSLLVVLVVVPPLAVLLAIGAVVYWGWCWHRRRP